MKNLKRNMKLELQTIYALRDIGDATRTELISELKRLFEIDVDHEDLLLALKRWKRKKVIVQTGQRDGEATWAIADVPFPPQVDMSMLRGISAVQAKKMIADIEERLLTNHVVVKSKLKYTNYQKFKLTFETLDEMLGGLPSADGDQTKRLFPKQGSTPFIPRRWLLGWLRINGRLKNLPQTNLRRYVGFSQGQFLDSPMIKELTIIGIKGPQIHEAVPKGSKFTCMIRFPMVGTEITSKSELEAFFKEIEDTPFSGLGAFYGARVKLLEMTSA